VAIAIAEALNHLHNECSRPIIHRDVKSSNILLSKDFQPQVLLQTNCCTSKQLFKAKFIPSTVILMLF
jgi:serine/threonine protein kinase